MSSTESRSHFYYNMPDNLRLVIDGDTNTTDTRVVGELFGWPSQCVGR